MQLMCDQCENNVRRMRNNAMKCEHKEGYYCCSYAYRALRWRWGMRWKVVVTARADLFNETHNTNRRLLDKVIATYDVLF